MFDKVTYITIFGENPPADGIIGTIDDQDVYVNDMIEPGVTVSIKCSNWWVDIICTISGT